ncbi:MAG TPA: HAD hydrolase-like protein [Paraburkholderia sp.]|nr:HAD hydrolase-like protein [Paraburkholderia sp.]
MATRLAIFDFDGTLANTWPVFSRSLNTLAARHGFREVHADEVPRLRRLGAGEILRELQLPLWRVPAVLSDFRAIMQREVAQVASFAGLTDALHTLADNHVALALATSNSIANVNAVLGARLINRFAAIECGSPLFGKPHRLRQILKRTQIPQHDAIYIGDEIRDAEAASRVGVRFGAVAWGYTDIEALIGQHPHAVFREPADIAHLGRV